jgi:hypothetical protein
MDNLEKTFKDALSDFDRISPSKGLWSRISRSMFFQSKLKLGLIITAALLLISAPAYYFLKTNKAETKSTITQQSTTEANTIVPQKKNTSQKDYSTRELNHDNRLAPITTKTKETSQTSKANKTKQKDIKTNKNKESITPKSNAITSPVTAKRKSKEQSNNNHQATPYTKSSAGLTASGVAVTTGDVRNNANAGPIHNRQQTKVSKTADTKAPAVINKNPENDLLLSENTVAQKRNYEFPKMETLFLNPDYNIGNIETPALKILRQQRQLYYNRIEVFAGPNIAFNLLQSSNPAADTHVSLRNSSEQPKLSYHAGFNYKSFYKNWYISIGAGFHRIQDRATYSLPTMDLDSTISNFMVFRTKYHRTIVGYMTNPNDTTSLIPIYQTTTQQDTSIVQQVIYDSTESIKSYSYTNTYSYIEIPLLVGHQFHYKSLIFDLAGGISWNRLIQYEVNLPNLENNRLLNSGQLEQMLVRNTFNAIFSAGIGYGINEGKVLFIRPEFRYNLNNMFDKHIPVQQKYIQLRLSLGMQFQF